MGEIIDSHIFKGDVNSIEELQRWFRLQGASKREVCKAVRLLDRVQLEAEPRPRKWNRRGHFPIEDHCRYLWYRHAARLLGWCDRHQFPQFVRDLLRQVFKSSPKPEDEEGSACLQVQGGPNLPPVSTTTTREFSASGEWAYGLEFCTIVCGPLVFEEICLGLILTCCIFFHLSILSFVTWR